MRPSAKLTLLSLAVALVVGCQSPPTPPDPVALVGKLKSADSQVSGPASLELIRLGEPGVPALVELLRDPDPAHRALAARTFWGMGAKGASAAPALAEALADPEPRYGSGRPWPSTTWGPPPRLPWRPSPRRSATRAWRPAEVGGARPGQHRSRGRIRRARPRAGPARWRAGLGGGVDPEDQGSIGGGPRSVPKKSANQHQSRPIIDC